MDKCEYTIEIKVSDNEIKQICRELGDRALTEENLDKYSRTWRRILERVGEQMAKIEQKEQRNGRRKSYQTGDE